MGMCVRVSDGVRGAGVCARAHACICLQLRCLRVHLHLTDNCRSIVCVGVFVYVGRRGRVCACVRMCIAVYVRGRASPGEGGCSYCVGINLSQQDFKTSSKSLSREIRRFTQKFPVAAKLAHTYPTLDGAAFSFAWAAFCCKAASGPSKSVCWGVVGAWCVRTSNPDVRQFRGVYDSQSSASSLLTVVSIVRSGNLISVGHARV